MSRSGVAVAAAVAVVTAMGLFVIWGFGGARGPSAPGATVGNSIDLSSFGPFQIRFAPESAEGVAVSQQQAVSSALEHSFGATDASGQLLSGVEVNAQYGLFSDDKMTVEQSGTTRPVFQQVPVWIVTVSGATVGVPRLGPAPPEAAVQPRRAARDGSAVANTEALVIDARTGEWLETFD